MSASRTSSPLLRQATRACAYFDHRLPNGRRGPGRWVTLIRSGASLTRTFHECQADAYAHIGSEGGSTDPHYRPEPPRTDYVVTLGNR